METSNSSNGETLFDLTLFAADTHASHLALPATDEEKTIQGISGPTFERPLANFDPNTQSWKMYGDTSLWEEYQSLEILPLSGMTRNGILYERPLLEDLIVESGSSLWPTPTIHGEIIGTRIEAARRRLQAGLVYSSRLTQAIALRYPEDVGYLSPMWTELLMGFPPGWTDLED